MTSNSNNYASDTSHRDLASSPENFDTLNPSMDNQSNTYQGYGYGVYGTQANGSSAYAGYSGYEYGGQDNTTNYAYQGNPNPLATNPTPYSTPHGGYMNRTARPFHGDGYHNQRQFLSGSPHRNTRPAPNQAISRRFQSQVTAATPGRRPAIRAAPTLTAPTPTAPTPTAPTPTPTLSTQPPAIATVTLTRESSSQRINHLQAIQRELLLNYQVAATAVKEMVADIDESWAQADTMEHKNEVYAKEAKLEGLKANCDSFGRMYRETEEEIEEVWVKVYTENGSIMG